MKLVIKKEELYYLGFALIAGFVMFKFVGNGPEGVLTGKWQSNDVLYSHWQWKTEIIFQPDGTGTIQVFQPSGTLTEHITYVRKDAMLTLKLDDLNISFSSNKPLMPNAVVPVVVYHYKILGDSLTLTHDYENGFQLIKKKKDE